MGASASVVTEIGKLCQACAMARARQKIARKVRTQVPAEDPLLRSLREAPMDDEPETPEEAAAVAEAREAIKRGEVISHEELRRRLGL